MVRVRNLSAFHDWRGVERMVGLVGRGGSGLVVGIGEGAEVKRWWRWEKRGDREGQGRGGVKTKIRNFKSAQKFCKILHFIWIHCFLIYLIYCSPIFEVFKILLFN